MIKIYILVLLLILFYIYFKSSHRKVFQNILSKSELKRRIYNLEHFQSNTGFPSASSTATFLPIPDKINGQSGIQEIYKVIKRSGTTKTISIDGYQMNKTDIQKKYGPIENWNTILVTDMSKLFSGNWSLIKI